MKDFINELQDMRYLNWAETKLSPGTPGCFLKAYDELGGKRYYYKLSNYDSYRGVFGHECINELIVSRLLDILGIEHLHYDLIHALISVDGKDIETYITRSENFKAPDERKQALETFYDLHKLADESPLDFMLRMGWERYVYQLILTDYLILNRDRHGANIEVLIKPDGETRLSPLFDNGCSLLFSCYNDRDEIRAFDVMKDRPVNNFIGSRSTEYNLSFLPKDKSFFSGSIKAEDKRLLFEGLDGILSEEHLDKIWELIYKRWIHYEEICN